MAKAPQPSTPSPEPIRTLTERAISAVRTFVAGDEWAGLRAALESGDLSAARRELADHSMPVQLAGVFMLVLERARVLQATIDAAPAKATLDALRGQLAILKKASPPTVADLEVVSRRLESVETEERKIAALYTAGKYAEERLGGLQEVFSELFTGRHGTKIHGGTLDPDVWNAMVEQGFDMQSLYAVPWQVAFRLEYNRERRRRLRAVQPAPQR